MISKVKTVGTIKEWGEGNNKTFYHSCTLEDGQFISIGKKQSGAIKEGDEIEYEMIDDGKGGQKAKEVKKTFVKGGGFQKAKPNNAGFALAYAKDIAVAYIGQGKELISTQGILEQADLFYKWMQSHENQS